MSDFYYSNRYCQDDLMWHVCKNYNDSAVAVFMDGFYTKSEAEDFIKELKDKK